MDKNESQQNKKKGAAPFASIEDLSDDSPEDRAKLEVPGARSGVTPRIDISRASSSSHHEDSSPERELFGGEGGGVKVGLGFTEDMALELRSSTEELDFHEPEPERKSKRKKLQQQQAVVVTKYDLETEYEKEIRERKDSGCSEGGLLFIGGRTSRLSSIGSAASGGSGVSAGSAVSHLSAASNLSRASRCSSPHKMLLETSFCGPKPIPTLSLEAEYPPSESVEAALLKRKADPTGAILPNCLEVRDNKPRRCSSERAVRPQVPVQAARSSSARAPKRPNVSRKNDDNELFKIIPLHGSLDDDDDDSVDNNPVEDFQPENGIYIPLKGPIIDCRKQEEEQPKRKKPEMEDSELFKFISLHGDDDEDVKSKKINQSVQFKSWEEAAKWVDLTKPRSPEPPKPGRLELEKKKNGRSLGQIPRDDSRTPSPASSFSKGNIFRRSSDSSGSSKKSGGSGDSKSKKDSRNKSMFTVLFRKNVKEVPLRKSNYQEKTPIDPKLTNVEYKFKQDENVIDKDTVIIPLHSPDEVVEPLIRYDPNKDDSDILKDISPEIRPEASVNDKQRSSLDEHTIEKNIVVVDVINEDTKEPVKNKLRTPEKKEDFNKADMKELYKIDVLEQIKHETKAGSSEIKKNIKELTKKFEGLEIQHLECEPRVRRSSSVSSREIEYSKESIAKPEEENESPTMNQESLENGRQESDETVGQASQETVIENPTVNEECVGNDISPKHEEVVLSNVIQDEEIESLIKKEEDSENNLVKSEGHERQSSESEVDMEVEKEVEAEECDEERKGLFHQTDSQEDELPYIPTTLPQERSVAVPIIPIRQRVSEVKTCPVERPRSTTPIQPSNLDEYATFHEHRSPLTQEKMQITLPRTDSFGKGRGHGKASSPPPLPPRAPQWVAFDEPERRRPPRRITTLPYTYVNPEECTCECHEAQHRSSKDSQCSKPEQCSYPKKSSRTEKEKRYRT